MNFSDFSPGRAEPTTNIVLWLMKKLVFRLAVWQYLSDKSVL